MMKSIAISFFLTLIVISGYSTVWTLSDSKLEVRFDDQTALLPYDATMRTKCENVITVHNETRASQFGCPFIDEPWCDMATMQGPKTLHSETLFSGLSMNHRPTKVSYANETLWTGNIYHPAYSNDRIRKNTYTILFSGSILNFADNNGVSSTGFSGTMELKDVNQEKHDIVSAVHNWFATIPFSQMTTRQDLVRQGYCLANEGAEYYIYLDTLGKTELYLDYPYPFKSEWINAKNPSDIRKGISVLPPTNFQHTTFKTPSDGDDWILHVYAACPTENSARSHPLPIESGFHHFYNVKVYVYFRRIDLLLNDGNLGSSRSLYVLLPSLMTT